MSQRQGKVVDHRVYIMPPPESEALAAEGLPSPNLEAPLITVHVRVYWPQNATLEQIQFAMAEAVKKMELEVLREKLNA